MSVKWRTFLALAALVCVAASASVSAPAAPSTSIDWSRTVAFRPCISGNGRFVAFVTNEQVGDKPGGRYWNVRIYDSESGNSECLTPEPSTADASQFVPQVYLNYDGSIALFDTVEPGIVPEDQDGARDVYYLNRRTGNYKRLTDGLWMDTTGQRLARSISLNEAGSMAAVIYPRTPDSSPKLHIFRDLMITGTQRRPDIVIDEPGFQPESVEMYGYHLVSKNGSQDILEVNTQAGETGEYVSQKLYSPRGLSLTGAPTFGKAGEMFATGYAPGDGSFTSNVWLLGHPFAGDTAPAIVALYGDAPNGDCSDLAAAQFSRYLAFVSKADNLIPGDTNGVADVFVYDLKSKNRWRVSVGKAGQEADGASVQPSISANGRYVAFASLATNLDSQGAVEGCNVYLHDGQTGTTVRVNRAASVDPDGEQKPSTTK